MCKKICKPLCERERTYLWKTAREQLGGTLTDDIEKYLQDMADGETNMVIIDHDGKIFTIQSFRFPPSCEGILAKLAYSGSCAIRYNVPQAVQVCAMYESITKNFDFAALRREHPADAEHLLEFTATLLSYGGDTEAYLRKTDNAGAKLILLLYEIWETETGQCVQTRKAHMPKAIRARYDKLFDYILSIPYNRSVRVKTENGMEMELRLSHEADGNAPSVRDELDKILVLAFSADSASLFVNSLSENPQNGTQCVIVQSAIIFDAGERICAGLPFGEEKCFDSDNRATEFHTKTFPIEIYTE